MKKKISKKQMSMVQKALAVAVDQSDSDVSAYLPTPLALQVIDYIRDLTIMRKLINTFTQPTRTWRKPKRASGGTAYYIPDGVTATETGFTSTTVEWVAKKLMSYVVVDEEAIEDSQPDLVDQILKDFGDAVAEAEDKMILAGDTSHTATAPDPGSATTSNWYVRDARLAFDGIFTLAAAAGAATSVDAASGAFDPEMVSKALYNLGKYARNRSKIIGIIPPEQAVNIRNHANWHDASKTGLALASFISGLGSAGEGDGSVANVYGIKLYEAPFAPTGHIAIFDKTSPELGDRRRIKFANDMVIEQDQRKFVVSERISFNVNYEDALCLIDALSETLVS
jgi:hypothetical protein